MSSKKQIAKKRSAIGEQLLAMGWKCTASAASQGSDFHREVYASGFNRIILPTTSVPCVTLQRHNSSGVDWFVDFPANIELSAILLFAEAA